MHLIGGSLLVAFFWACIALIDKYILRTLKSHTVLFIGSIATIVFAGIYSIYHKESIYADLTNLNPTLIFMICVATLMSVIIANIIYLELLKHHNTGIVTAIAYTAPVIVLLFSMIVFKETISFYSCIGVLMVICGTIIVALSHHESKN